MKSVQLTTHEELFSVEFNFASEPHKATDKEATGLGTSVHRNGGGGGFARKSCK